MHKPLLGQRIAVLVANGFNETDMTQAQRALQDSGADIRIVSMDQGLVNSWRDGSWGLNFVADAFLNKALAVDFDMLIVPGGQRSMDKLKQTAHTRRFVGGFVNAGKPVVAFDEANDLLVDLECMDGRIMQVSTNADTDMSQVMADMCAFLMDDATPMQEAA